VGAAERTITGHIDFLQVRIGCVHILDYKPDARTNKPIAQLAIYALALTRLVPGLKLFDIKCAWFNEAEYCFSRGCSLRTSLHDSSQFEAVVASAKFANAACKLRQFPHSVELAREGGFGQSLSPSFGTPLLVAAAQFR
jgi:hypothetical protein